MTDWRKKAEQVAIDLEVRKHEEEAEKERARQRAEEQERKRLLLELARKYRCCVCGKQSQKPYSYVEPIGTDYGVQTSGGGTVTKWSEPGDMAQCKKCGRWACTEPEEHIYAGICKNCASG